MSGRKSKIFTKRFSGPRIGATAQIVGIHVFASIVPRWIPFGDFWAVLTGIAFLLSGVAICSGIRDVLGARLLALMLFPFEALVEIPPIFIRPHNQGHGVQPYTT
jgi:uncharacterized membrane protein